MNEQAQVVRTKRTPQVPLYASPWVALFLILKKELTQPRPAR